MSSADGLKFTMSLNNGNKSNKGFLGHLSSFAFNVKKAFLFSLSFVLASTTGIAFGVGGPFDAFQASTAGKVLSPLQDNLRKYILLPSLVAGFITWCATYIKPMVESVRSFFQYQSNPELYELYKELNTLDKDLSWHNIDPKDKRSTIIYYLGERAKIINNFSYSSLVRFINSAETLYQANKCPDVKKIKSSDYVIAPEDDTSTALTRALIDHIRCKDDNDTIDLADIPKLGNHINESLQEIHKLDDLVKDSIVSNNGVLLDVLSNDKCDTDTLLYSLNEAKLSSLKRIYDVMNYYRSNLEGKKDLHSPAMRVAKLRLSNLAQRTIDEWFVPSYQEELQNILENYPSHTDNILDLCSEHAKTGIPTEYSYVDVTRYLTKLLGSFNAIFVNSIGVAIGFLSTISLLYTPTGGIYTASAGNWLIFALITGASAGFASAWFLTKTSLENTANKLFNVFYDPKFYNSALRVQIEKDQQNSMRERGEKLWSWLCLPGPVVAVLKPVMIGGFSIASSLFNYVSGVKGAILINSLAKYLMPNMQGDNPLVNLRRALQTVPLHSLPFYARVSGLVSAAVTFITTSALLIDVANTPRHKNDSSRKGFISSTMFALTFLLSVSGQLYMQTITTFWSHGLPGLLANLGLHTAYVTPVTYALGATVIPGMLVCAKLLSDATHDTLLSIIPMSKREAVNSKTISKKNSFSHTGSNENGWFMSLFSKSQSPVNKEYRKQ